LNLDYEQQNGNCSIRPEKTGKKKSNKSPIHRRQKAKIHWVRSLPKVNKSSSINTKADQLLPQSWAFLSGSIPTAIPTKENFVYNEFWYWQLQCWDFLVIQRHGSAGKRATGKPQRYSFQGEQASEKAGTLIIFPSVTWKQ